MRAKKFKASPKRIVWKRRVV